MQSRTEPRPERPPPLSKQGFDAAVALLRSARGDRNRLSDLEGTGPVRELELAWCLDSGASFALATANGTSALTVALLACGVGSGDEVVLSAYGWGQTVAAVLSVGATPVFADIDPCTFVLDPTSARRAIGPKTRAVLPTHLFGHPAPMVELEKLARAHGLWLIADAAQADGATLDGRPMGAFGDAAAYSLGRGKLTGAGEGGLVTFSDRRLYERAVLVSQHPCRAAREIETPELRRAMDGFCLTSRLSPVLAVIAHAELERAPALRERRRANAGRPSVPCPRSSRQLLRSAFSSSSGRSRPSAVPPRSSSWRWQAFLRGSWTCSDGSVRSCSEDPSRWLEASGGSSVRSARPGHDSRQAKRESLRVRDQSRGQRSPCTCFAIGSMTSRCRWKALAT